MADPTSEELDGLLALSETDSQIVLCNRRLDNLPEQQDLDAAQAERVQLEEELGDRRLASETAQARADKEDRQVDQLRERLHAEQQRMYGGEISNAKQLQSMRAEIDAVQRRIDEHEVAELEAMEEAEQLEATISDLDRQIAEADQRIEQLAERRDEAAQALLAEIAELEALADKQRAPLSPEVLARYDDARTRFRGHAVGHLDGDQCSACGIALSYADVNALFEGPPLTTCPSCQRLMVVR